MAREKKNAKIVNFNLEMSIIKMLENYSKETGIPKTVIVEKAIKEYLDTIAKKEKRK